ncbi:unnamed protein product [Paramecium sonneborni]|uniref:Uncharacterized protein n=1 Tax=Paramecium sonneborni TaxID=65129 RepID=A0A8S1QNM6_9CILI|nr:unnamed protein product [Paramecium sonneborni]
MFLMKLYWIEKSGCNFQNLNGKNKGDMIQIIRLNVCTKIKQYLQG